MIRRAVDGYSNCIWHMIGKGEVLTTQNDQHPFDESINAKNENACLPEQNENDLNAVKRQQPSPRTGY